MKRLLVIMLLIWSKGADAQYDGFYRGIIKAPPIFKSLKGVFKANKTKVLNVNGISTNQVHSYLYKGGALNLEYCYPERETDAGCSYFVIYGQRINLKGRFENDFACDLDVTSFSLYAGSYGGKEYILLTCINTGSGSSTGSVICNLFDVSDKKSIKYYPLWSKYGSNTCFGDFNKDGILDFLKVRIDGEQDRLRLTLMSLKGKTFVPDNDKNYMILNYNAGKLKVKERSLLK